MQFSLLSDYFRRLEETPSRNQITMILAELFRHASSSEIGPICYLLQGRVAPLYEPVEFGVADKFMIRAIAKGTGATPERVVSEFRRTGDLGASAQELSGQKKSSLSVRAVFERCVAITQESGAGSQEKKIELLAALFSDADSRSARYLARIPLGKLRLGFSDMTMLDGLSWMLAGDKSLRDELERVYNIRPDIGLLASEVKKHGSAGLSRVHATVGVPILAALCQRLPSASEMIEKMGEVAVEPKYDGVRVQIHMSPNGVRTYSRNLENTTEMFPELQDIGKYIRADEVILDAEAVGVDPKSGTIMSFQQTTTRKRKHNIQLVMGTVPLKFFVFDILYKDRKDVLSLPLKSRRKLLEDVVKDNDMLVVSPQVVTESATTIRSYHETQRKAGLEGVVVKQWSSPYEPGRRGYHWVKFKEEEGKTGKLTDTVDAVVMGYYRGEGKRAGFGIGAFLVGVRHGEEFVTVTKIGTGVSDELWRELKRQLDRLRARTRPTQYREVAKILTPDVWITPSVVVEVAADDITKSPSHGAGFALRFPRLVRIRTDKSPAQVTSVQEVHTMYRNQ